MKCVLRSLCCLGLAGCAAGVVPGCGRPSGEQIAAKRHVRQKVCPVSGRPVSTDFYVLYKGRTIYFSDRGSMMKFRREPERYAQKAEEGLK